MRSWIWHFRIYGSERFYRSCYTCCVSCARRVCPRAYACGSFSQSCGHCARPKSGSRLGYGCDRVVSCRRPGSLRLCPPGGFTPPSPWGAVVILVPVLRGILAARGLQKATANRLPDPDGRRSDGGAPHLASRRLKQRMQRLTDKMRAPCGHDASMMQNRVTTKAGRRKD